VSFLVLCGRTRCSRAWSNCSRQLAKVKVKACSLVTEPSVCAGPNLLSVCLALEHARVTYLPSSQGLRSRQKGMLIIVHEGRDTLKAGTFSRAGCSMVSQQSTS
jgi:hypothetical protein